MRITVKHGYGKPPRYEKQFVINKIRYIQEKVHNIPVLGE